MFGMTLKAVSFAPQANEFRYINCFDRANFFRNKELRNSPQLD